MLGIIFSPNRQRFRSQQFELNRTHNNLKIVIRNSSAGCQYMSAVFFIVGEDLVLEWLLKHCAIPYILMSLHRAPKKERKNSKRLKSKFFFVPKALSGFRFGNVQITFGVLAFEANNATYQI